MRILPASDGGAPRAARAISAGILLLLITGGGPPACRGEDAAAEIPARLSGPTLHPMHGWPVWLKDYGTGARTTETSAIEYLGKDATGAYNFFLADDVGFLHFCRVFQEADTGAVRLELAAVQTGRSLIARLADFEKWDFEALALALPRPRPDPTLADSVACFLAIEGRGERAPEQTCVLGIGLARVAPSGSAAPGRAEWRAETWGEAMPGANFWRGYVESNKGIEGLAISGRYVFLGFGGIGQRKAYPSRGSILFIFDRLEQRAANMGTLPLGIHSICGLDAPADTLTFVMDRDRLAITVLRWDLLPPERVLASYRFALDLPAPGGFRYGTPSLEGIAVDDRGDIWCVTDPRSGEYHVVGAAPESLHVYLAAEMPMLYRFSGEPVWKTMGLAAPGGGGE